VREKLMGDNGSTDGTTNSGTTDGTNKKIEIKKLLGRECYRKQFVKNLFVPKIRKE
jgi:hypothetical protein